MAESTIVLRSPVKSASASFVCSSPSSPTHHSTVIILKDNIGNEPHIPLEPSPTVIRSSTINQTSIPSLRPCQPKLYYAGHTGLYNLGNTCYVNCVLQLLSHVPQFCDAICSMSFESLGLEQPSDTPMATSSHNPTRLKGGGRGLLKALEAQPRRVPCYLAYELHGTFNIIWSGKCMVYSPLNMIAAVRRLLPSFEPCAMEDAQEFLEALLAAVTDEIKTNKLADTNIINDLLGFSSESQILCEQCHRLSVTKTDETFITLTFSEKMLSDSRGSSRRRSCHLTEMLAHFYQWEALSTPFQCSNCIVKSPSREGTKAQKRLLISKLPQVLHIVLRRFRSLPQTNLRRPSSRQARQLSHKITMHVNFDEYLNMAPYCKQSRNNSVPFLRTKPNEDMTSECFYRLRGVIVHYGKSINTGHFVAFVYNDLLGEWLRCDDHIIEQTTFESVKTSDAYILVYSRCSSSSVPSSVLMKDPELSMKSDVCKRKRAISVDQIKEKKDSPNDDNRKNTYIDYETLEKESDSSNNLNFFCVDLNPLTHGFRRRAQSLNFVIRGCQASIDPSDLATRSTGPVIKRRRRDPNNPMSTIKQELSQSSIVHAKSITKLSSKSIVQTKGASSVVLATDDPLSTLVKIAKTTRRRRRTDSFTRRRRITKKVDRRTREVTHSNTFLSTTTTPTTEMDSIPSTTESLLPILQTTMTTTMTPVICEDAIKISSSSTSSNKRIGRIRIQRCIERTTGTIDSTFVPPGETPLRIFFSSQTAQSSSFLFTSVAPTRRSIPLNNLMAATTASATNVAKSSITLSLHPLVIMQIAEHYTRVRVQTASAAPVYGALLSKIKGRHVELCNTFEFKLQAATNLTTDSQPTIDMDSLTKKLELIKQVHQDLDFTGWYTVEGKDWNTSLMSSFYTQLSSLNESPLILRLDPFGLTNELPIHVYETIVDLGTKIDFIEIPYSLVTEEAERIGIDHVARYSVTDGTSDTSIVSDQIAIQYNAIRLLYQRMLVLLEYVRAVKQGQLERNEDLLREIGSLCQRLPIINTDDNNNQMFREDFDIQQSDVALLALLACCTQEISTLNDYLNKFQVVHEKQQHSAGPGGSFGYSTSGRRMARTGAYFPASYV